MNFIVPQHSLNLHFLHLKECLTTFLPENIKKKKNFKDNSNTFLNGKLIGCSEV